MSVLALAGSVRKIVTVSSGHGVARECVVRTDCVASTTINLTFT